MVLCCQTTDTRVDCALPIRHCVAVGVQFAKYLPVIGRYVRSSDIKISKENIWLADGECKVGISMLYNAKAPNSNRWSYIRWRLYEDDGNYARFSSHALSKMTTHILTECLHLQELCGRVISLTLTSSNPGFAPPRKTCNFI